MYDFLILTTAITRPDLHQRLFPGYLPFIDGATVKWLIHVDNIDNRASVAETVASCQRLLAPAENIDLEFLFADGRSCFFSAARRLAGRAHALLPVCKTGVLWLEDDWEISTRTPLARWLNQRRVKRTRGRGGQAIRPCPGTLREKQAYISTGHEAEQGLWYMSLVPKVNISFNPSVWSKALFTACVYLPLMRVKDGRIADPEDLCCDPLNEPAAYRRLCVFADPLFQDVGHRWIAAHELKKWQKDSAYLATQGAASYSTRARASSEVQASLAGFFLLPDLLLHTSLQFLVQVAWRKGRLTVRLPGVPWASFELIVNDDLSTEVYLHRLHGWAQKSEFTKTKATIDWRHDPASGRLQTATVSSPMGDFSSAHHRRPPPFAVWILPLQTVLGLGVYLFTLWRLMRGLRK